MNLKGEPQHYGTLQLLRISSGFSQQIMCTLTLSGMIFQYAKQLLMLQKILHSVTIKPAGICNMI